MAVPETFVSLAGATLRVRRTSTDTIVVDTVNHWELKERDDYRDNPEAKRAQTIDILGERYRLRLRVDPVENLAADKSKSAECDGWAVGLGGLGLIPERGDRTAAAPQWVRRHVLDKIFPALAAWLDGPAGQKYLAATRLAVWTMKHQRLTAEIDHLQAQLDERRAHLKALEAQRDMIEQFLRQ